MDRTVLSRPERDQRAGKLGGGAYGHGLAVLNLEGLQTVVPGKIAGGTDQDLFSAAAVRLRRGQIVQIDAGVAVDAREYPLARVAGFKGRAGKEGRHGFARALAGEHAGKEISRGAEKRRELSRVDLPGIVSVAALHGRRRAAARAQRS